MSAKVAAAAWDECLVEVAGPPAGWWYVRPVPRSLQHSLGRRSIRRYLASTLPQAHRQAADVHEQVERLLGLSAGELQLRGREVRLVARDSARRWRERLSAAALPTPSRPDESELVELLMNGFRSRGLVLEESDFLEAREAFLGQLSRPLPPLPAPRHRPNTVAGWVAARQRLRRVGASTRLAWQRELRRLLAFSDVSLPGAITEGAAFRWRNHVLSSVSLATAQRRLSLIDAFYADALRSALVEHNPFASLPPLLASSLPLRPLNPELLQQLDQERCDDPIYGLVRWLGLRPSEVARLRPLDWSLLDGHPVLWVRASRSAQKRCIPIPGPLMPLWQQCSGTDESPLWTVAAGLTPQRLARRWSDGLRRNSFCSASQLRQERRRQWREQGLPEPLVRHLLGGSAADGVALERLKAWLDQSQPMAAQGERMLHCPTETTQNAVCA